MGATRRRNDLKSLSASALAISLCVVLGGCRKTEPPAETPPSKADVALADLLRRADAVAREGPDTAPPPPQTDTPGPEPVVTMPNFSPRTPPYSGAYYPPRPNSGAYYPPRSYGGAYYQPRRYPGSTEREKTDLEKMQEQAGITFWHRIVGLAQSQSTLTALRVRQVIACTGSSNVTVSIIRRPNAALNPNVPQAANSYPPPVGAFQKDNANSPECHAVTAALITQEKAFRDRLDQLDIDAKKMGIYPGVMRELYTRAGIT